MRSALVSALLSCTCLNRTILRTLMLAFPHLSQHITSSISGATARRQSWSHHQSICLCARRLSQWRVPFTGNGTWVRGGCPARRSCRNRSLSFKLESSLQGPGARFQPTPKIPTAGRKMPLQAGKPRPPIARAARNQELKQYFSQVLPYLRFGCFLCQLRAGCLVSTCEDVGSEKSYESMLLQSKNLLSPRRISFNSGPLCQQH